MGRPPTRCRTWGLAALTGAAIWALACTAAHHLIGS